MSVCGFRFSFTPLTGVLFAVPSRYSSLSVAVSYLALDRGRPGFKQGFSCPALLRYRTMESDIFRIRGFHAVSRAFPDASATYRFSHQLHGSSPCGPATPYKGFRLLRVRSPLLAQSLLISLPALLRWFTSRSIAPPQYLLPARGVYLFGIRVTPFGYLRISGCVLLPAAFRSLPRPSSPDSS